MRDRDDRVGYGRPPKHSQFKKGQSGNPKGRPKGAVGLVALLKEEINKKVVVTINGERKTISLAQATVRQLVNKAAMGDHKAVMALIRLEGSFGNDTKHNSADLTRTEREELELLRMAKSPYAHYSEEELDVLIRQRLGDEE